MINLKPTEIFHWMNEYEKNAKIKQANRIPTLIIDFFIFFFRKFFLKKLLINSTLNLGMLNLKKANCLRPFFWFKEKLQRYMMYKTITFWNKHLWINSLRVDHFTNRRHTN